MLSSLMASPAVPRHPFEQLSLERLALLGVALT